MRHTICGMFFCAAAFSAVFIATASVRAETCSLDLKYRETDQRGYRNQQDYLYWMTRPQQFFVQLSQKKNGPPVFQGEGQYLAEFLKIVKKEPEYQSKIPFRGVVEFGGQKYAFALDESSPKPKDEKAKPDADKKKEDNKKGDQPAVKQQEKQKPIEYNRLFFDRNRNGDLTDDEVIKTPDKDTVRTASPQGNFSFATIIFPSVEITLNAGGTEYKYAFNVSGNTMLRKEFGYVNLQFNSATSREGEITLNGKKHRVILSDFNSNGRFDDEISIRENVRGIQNEIYLQQGDMIMIDPDFNTTGYQSPYNVTESDFRNFVSKMIVIDGRYHDMKITPSGDKITLTPSDVALGTITNPNKKYRALIYGDKGFLKISGEANTPIPVPVGQWKLCSYQIDMTEYPEPKKPKAETPEVKKPAAEKEDKSGSKESPITKSLGNALKSLLGGGDNPNLRSSAKQILHTDVSAQATRDYPAVTVVEGKTSEFPFGPPYKPIVVVRGVQEKSVNMALSIVGSKGEICSDMTVRGGRPSKPSFKITNAKGEVVQQGNFEYG